ncbi:MAG: hypothetical protein D8M58_09245 [Calditrichaeota bacterium]|nr:MAG: hypothetical protein DWQ03_17245 [Calditrichota bacterium]MBL1205571.1 hypothetical protein [Calditrichota bacterium]NOG45400.1 hypothetical protein [Calditrichota bacterium]
MSRNKLFFGVLLVVSLFMIQCATPWRTDNVNNTNTYSKSIIGDWKTIDATWSFKDNGELSINHNSGAKETGSWVVQEEQIEIVINEERMTLYTIELLTDTKLKLSSNLKTIILIK